MANVWREPIFDRTLQDVEFAIQKIEAWKKNHTHSVDVRVENDAFILQDGATAYVDDDKFILQEEGAVYIEDGVVILDIDDVYDLKGCLNSFDLNRIEENVAYIADKMESFFFHPNIHHKRWGEKDLPNQNDMTRIMNNIRSITGSFYSPNNAPSLPTTMLSYADINAIEENLYLIKELLDCLESSFKKTGTITSGSTTFLPIRR
jgi:hypothetical protein